MLGYTTLTAAFTSSIFSASTLIVAATFHVDREVGLLGVSLYVLGFATGPIIVTNLGSLTANPNLTDVYVVGPIIRAPWA